MAPDPLASWPVRQPGAARLRADLLRRYAEPHRRYHDRRHLCEVLVAIDTAAAPAVEDLRTVRLAAWFHDAVYDPRRSDNEEHSARLAVSSLPAQWAAEVARLVRLTATHRPRANDLPGSILCDADLSILGARPERYHEYATAIRVEYSWVSDADFRRARTQVLHRLLSPEGIYRTPTARQRWERQAQQNLRQELTDLASGAAPPR